MCNRVGGPTGYFAKTYEPTGNTVNGLAFFKALTEPTKQEQMTLQFTKIDRPGARLACQTRVIGEGIIIQLPKGTFVESEQDLVQEIGKKAKKTLIHPMTGEVLVEAGKLVMRSALEKMKQASDSFAANFSNK